MPSASDSAAFLAPSRGGSQSSHFQSLGAYSAFLRSAMADEESLQLRDSLQALALQVEAMMVLLPQPPVDAAAVAQALLHLADDLRGHRTMLLSLGGDWHHFYEFDAHFSTVNQFRLSLNRWAMQAAPPVQTAPSSTDFELAAWRVLGAGAMLLDVYEQSRPVVAQPPAAVAPVTPWVPTWWQRVRGWWRRPATPQKEQRKSARRGRRRLD